MKYERLAEDGDVPQVSYHQHVENSSRRPSCRDSECISDHEIKSTDVNKNATAIKKLTRVFLIAFIFMVAEFVGGWLSNSLAIMSDSAHLLSDVAGYGISLIALYLGARVSSKDLTYGYSRVEVVGALLSIVILWIVLGVLLYEGVDRLRNPEKVEGKLMLIVASVGLAVNIIMGAILIAGGHSHSHGLQQCHGHGGDAHSGHGHSHSGHGHGHGHGQHSSHSSSQCSHHDHGHGHGHGHNHGHGHGHSASPVEEIEADHHEHGHGHSDHGHGHGHSDHHGHGHGHSDHHEHGHGHSDHHEDGHGHNHSDHEKDEHKHSDHHGHGHGHSNHHEHEHKHSDHHGHGHKKHSDHHAHGHGHEHKHSDHHGHGHGHGHEHKHSDHHGHNHGYHDHGHDHRHRPEEEPQRHDTENINVHAAFVHVVADALQSFGVVISSAFVWYDEKRFELADPICTIVFAALGLFFTIGPIRDIMSIFLMKSPRGIDTEALLEDIRRNQKSQSYHSCDSTHSTIRVTVLGYEDQTHA